MRDNWSTALVGARVTLVPYRREHVEKYHEWMSDPALLEATASEALSLEEEYAMQVEWHENPKNCTFIILSNASSGDEVSRMVGDVNMFMHDHDDAGNAELEIMIAEKSHRGQGIGKEAVQLMMHYGLTAPSLQITRFFVKIHETNLVSIGLFNQLGFREVNFVPAFQEHELALVVADEDNRERIIAAASHAVTTSYPLSPPPPRLRVLARVRPLSEAEARRIAAGEPCSSARAASYGEVPESECVRLSTDSASAGAGAGAGAGVHLEPPGPERSNGQSFAFDGALTSDQDLEALLTADSDAALDVLGRSTLICFGQTNSGKTHTAAAAMRRLASHLPQSRLLGPGSLSMSFFELRGEHVYDLLASDARVTVREDGQGRVVVLASEAAITSFEQALQLLDDCMERRLTRGTTKNDVSSRSHAFCTFSWRAPPPGGGADQSAGKTGKVVVADLAGSERWEDSLDHSSERLAETKSINSSLGCLKHCLSLLSHSLAGGGGAGHIPFRNSKLTMVLKNELQAASPSGAGSDERAVIFVVHLSPLLSDRRHSHNSLLLAQEIRSGSLGRLERESAETRLQGGPLAWGSNKVSQWVASLGAEYTVLAESFRISGKVLHGEWIGHVERRVEAAGGTAQQAHFIYDSFHELVQSKVGTGAGADKKGGDAKRSLLRQDLAAFAARFVADQTVLALPAEDAVQQEGKKEKDA